MLNHQQPSQYAKKGQTGSKKQRVRWMFDAVVEQSDSWGPRYDISVTTVVSQHVQHELVVTVEKTTRPVKGNH